jgi:hypothetical protein
VKDVKKVNNAAIAGYDALPRAPGRAPACAASRHDWNSSAARDGRGERRSRLTNRHW